MSVPDFRPAQRMPFGFWRLCLLLAAVAGLSLLIVPGVFVAVLHALAGAKGAPATAIAIAMLAQSAVMFGVFYGLAIRFWGVSWWQVGLRPASLGWYLGAVLLAALAILATSLVNLAMEALLGGPIENPQVGMLTPGGASPLSALAMFFLIAGVAPVVEELLFRGLVYGWIRERFGIWPGLLVSSLIFSCVHGIPMLIPPLFVVGCFLAWLYEKSGSILPCMVMHAVFNGAMLAALYGGLSGL